MKPTPGDQRALNGGLEEAVDPASGNVSISVQAPMPPDRGVSLPVYAWTYNSAGNFNFAPRYGTSYAPNNPAPFVSVTGLYLQSSGLPAYLPNSVNKQIPALSDYVAVGPGSHTVTCNPWTHYVYTDSTGGNHPLGLYHIVPSEDKTDGCNHWGLSGTNYQGGDEFYRATLDPETLVVTVTDLHGNRVAAADPTQSQQFQTADTNGNLGKGTGNDANLSVTALYGALQYSSLTVPGVSGSYSYTYTTSTPQGVEIDATNTSDGGGCLSSAKTTYSDRAESTPILTKLTLPDNRFYTFEYDPAYGRISKITYPSGATVKYTWQIVLGMEDLAATPFIVNRSSNSAPATCNYKYDWPAIKTREVSYDGTNVARSETYDYSVTRTSGQAFWSSRVVKVTTSDYLVLQAGGQPTKSIVIHTYGPGSQYGDAATLGTLQTTVPAESSTQYQDGLGTTLRTVYKSWASPKLLAAECTVLDDGSMKGVFYQYQAVGSGYPVTGNPTDVAEYDFGTLNGNCVRPAAGSPTRETKTTYATFDPPAYASGFAAILDRPATVQRYAGGTLIAETDYSYDGQTTSAVTAINHDDTNYPVGRLSRGNLIASTTKCFNSCPDLVHAYTYDATGQRTSDKVGGNTTNYSYADSFSASSNPPAGNTNAYLTTVTRPTTSGHSHADSFVYNFGSGTVASHTDENSNKTSFAYVDTWSRQTEVDYPDGGVTTTSYNDTGNSPSVSKSQKLDSSRNMSWTTTYNGVGIRTQDAMTSAPGGATVVDYTIDGFGRVVAVSNPYQGTPGKSTGYSFDALGRMVKQVNPDSTTKQWSYSGATTTVKDEASNSWSQSLDGLGRLVAVLEPNGAYTSYSYDGLDNLLTAVQWGNSTPGSTGGDTRTRSFTYDSLSRLITSSNPETGTVCYGKWSGTSVGTGTCQNGYDASGNLLARTDARGEGAQYAYDALNRLTLKSYYGLPQAPDPHPVKLYYYDGDNEYGQAGLSGSNVSGRLTGARSWAPFENHLTDEVMGYDAMGRIVKRNEVSQSEHGSGGHTTYVAYDLSGHITHLVYPDGRGVSQTFDAAGRLSAVTDDNGTAYVSSVSYNPNGTPSEMHFSNTNMVEYTSLNSRLQVCGSTVANGFGSNPLLARLYYYGSDTTWGKQCDDAANNNGNLRHVLGIKDSAFEQDYTYDSLNRLTLWTNTSISGNISQQSYGYDSFGNMAMANSATAPSVTGKFTAANRQVSPGANDCWSYDGAGNLNCYGVANSNAHSYFYNEEGELVVAYVAQNSTTNTVGVYSFDSSGTRVRADNPTNNTWREYTYFNGQVLAEKDNTGNWTDHIFANGKRIASIRPTVVLHHMGTCGNCSNGASDFMVSQLATELKNYTLRAGDKLVFQQKQTNARAGLYLIATDGSNSMCSLVDQFGDCMNASNIANGTWITRLVDLSSWAGKQISTNVGVSVEANTPQGIAWDSQIADVALVSNDGQVHTMYHGQPASGTAIQTGAGASFGTLSVNTTPSGPQTVQISFTNDACSCTGNATSGDRNLFVTQVASGSNIANLSTAGGAHYDTCNQDNGNLYCAGSMFVTVPYGGPLTVSAYGTLADGIPPHMQVRLNGELVGEYDVPQSGQTYTLSLSSPSDLAVETTYFAADQVGTTAMEFANDAWPIQRTEFAPFGQELSDPNDTSSRYKFTGKERDTESGLDNFGARSYTSGLGRFMSPDWSAKADPIPYASLTDPQSLNLYAYVRNNPLTGVDPDGHAGLDCTGTNGSGYGCQLRAAWNIQYGVTAGAWLASGFKDIAIVKQKIAEAASSMSGSMKYAISGATVSGIGVTYGKGTNKCNEFVCDATQKGTGHRAQVPKSGILGWLGQTRDPTAKEWATLPIAGWSSPRSLSTASPGDVIAMAHHDDNEGHVGIYVGGGLTASANAYEGGRVTINNWGFRGPMQNGEHPGDAGPVVRTWVGIP